MPGSRFASIVLPLPGGPIIKMLCPPAAATSSARFAVCWPRTSLKSNGNISVSCSNSNACTRNGGADNVPKLSAFSSSRTSFSVRTGKTSTPSTTAASRAFAAGTINLRIPWSRASTAIGSTPGTARTAPSKPSSPIIRKPLSSRACSAPYAPRMPTAIGKSNPDPSFFRSAGARLTVIRVVGRSNPEFRIADCTRSRLSRTAVSGRPTMLKMAFSSLAPLKSTSTSIK